VDFQKDILTSKTLQLLLSIMKEFHSKTCLPILQQYERPEHLVDMINGTIVILNSFLMHASASLTREYDLLIEKQKKLNNGEESPAMMQYVYNNLQQ